jgi:uncharacterized spore protein YtfJ
MTDQNGQAFEDAQEAAGAGVAGLLETMLDGIGLNAGAKAVFGVAIEKNGRTVIPVAQMMIGTGAGGGDSKLAGHGTGAGGGALTRPLGYIEISDEQTEFVPLRRPLQDPVVIISVAFAAYLAAKAISKLLRG